MQALSPPLLARCLVCPDATIERLALLTDVGAAGKSRLPPIHLILTSPEVHFQETLADMAQRQLKQQQLMDLQDGRDHGVRDVSMMREAVAAKGSKSARSSLEGGESFATDHAAPGRVNKLKGRQGLQHRASNDDDDPLEDVAVEQGVLGGDMSWRRTLSALAEALQQSVAAAAGSSGRKPAGASSRA